MSELRECRRCKVVHRDCPICGENCWNDAGSMHWCDNCETRILTSKMDWRFTEDALNGKPITMEREISNTLGKALGYPEDPQYGLVVGDHTAVSLADEAAQRIKELEAKLAVLIAERCG